MVDVEKILLQIVTIVDRGAINPFIMLESRGRDMTQSRF